MKKIKVNIGIMGIAVFLVMLSAVSAVDATVVKVEPVSQTVSSGQPFSVNVTVEGVTYMGADQATLNFDPSAMTVSSVTEGDFLKSVGATIGVGMEDIDNTNGYVTFFYSLKTEGIGVDDSGTLATINFDTNASADDVFDLSLTDVLLADGDGNTITVDEVSDGTVTITGVAPMPDVVINEIMWDELEYIELYNNGSSEVSIGGWNITAGDGETDDDVEIVIDAGAIIPAGEYYLIADSGAVTGISVDEIDDMTFIQGGEIVQLFNGDPATATLIDIANEVGSWFAGANTDVGESMERTTPPGAGTVASNWYTSTGYIGGRIGTPGQPNSALTPEVDTTAPITEVTIPPDATTIPSGTELPWTNEDVNISFRRTDNVGGTGVNYTNYSKTSETGPWTTVNATTAIGTDADNVSAITDETFNVTVSDEGITKIYYYSVDKNETPKNVEDTKNLTVRIDKTAPDIISVELNKTSVNASEQILVSVNVIDPQNGEVASGIAKVTATAYATATPVELTQDGNWWNGTITAATSGLHNVTVTAYDNASNTATNDTMQYEVLVIAEITAFEIENPTADLGQNFVARINVNTTENATAGWYVVVVSGVNETTGEGLAGIGTVRMVKNDFVENMPVLVHIPPVTPKLSYELYAGLYRLEDYPSKLENILDHEGPETVTVI